MKQPRLIDINSKWYRPALMPKYERPVLIQSVEVRDTYMGTDYKYAVIILHELTGRERWEDEKKDGMIRWCYIEDVLPK